MGVLNCNDYVLNACRNGAHYNVSIPAFFPWWNERHNDYRRQVIHVICTLKMLDAWVVRKYSSTPIVRRLSACSKLISLIRSIDYHNFLELNKVVVVVSRMRTAKVRVRVTFAESAVYEQLNTSELHRVMFTSLHFISRAFHGGRHGWTIFWFIEKAGSAISDVSAATSSRAAGESFSIKVNSLYQR